MNDDQLYLAVTEEVISGKIDAALWAKAIAKALGDEEKGKYEYINLRVKQIKESSHDVNYAPGDERYMPEGSQPTVVPNVYENITEPEGEFVVTSESDSSENSSSNNEYSKSSPNEPVELEGVFQKLIQGKYGLAKTYWGFWMGIGLIILILSNVIGTMGSPTLALVWYAATIAYSVILWIAIWRSATLYTGAIIWAGLARLAVVFGMLATLNQVMSIFNPAQ